MILTHISNYLEILVTWEFCGFPVAHFLISIFGEDLLL